MVTNPSLAFLASLHLGIARRLEGQRRMRERMWDAHVELAAMMLVNDTTVHTLFGDEMGRPQELQPQEQGQEEFPAYPDVLDGDAGIHQR